MARENDDVVGVRPSPQQLASKLTDSSCSSPVKGSLINVLVQALPNHQRDGSSDSTNNRFRVSGDFYSENPDGIPRKLMIYQGLVSWVGRLHIV